MFSFFLNVNLKRIQCLLKHFLTTLFCRCWYEEPLETLKVYLLCFLPHWDSEVSSFKDDQMKSASRSPLDLPPPNHLTAHIFSLLRHLPIFPLLLIHSFLLSPAFPLFLIYFRLCSFIVVPTAASSIYSLLHSEIRFLPCP